MNVLETVLTLNALYFSIPAHAERATRRRFKRVIAPSMDAAWNAAQPRLASLSAVVASLPPVSRSVQRVGQLDADQLDQDLVLLLKEPFAKALGLLNVRFTI